MLLDGLGIGGYRSFGGETQFIENLGKVNIIIGKNNSGKSNVLRFMRNLQGIIHRAKNTRFSSPEEAALFDELIDIPRGLNNQRIKFYINVKEDSIYTGDIYRILSEVLPNLQSRVDEWRNGIWLPYIIPDTKTGKPEFLIDEVIPLIEKSYTEEEIHEKVAIHFGYRGKTPEIRLRDLCTKLDVIKVLEINVQTIDAYRQITSESNDWEMNGKGLIKKLNELKEPLIGREDDRKKFEQINLFVKEILGEKEARIDIPYTVDQIYVEMNNRRLPIESLGNGIHQIIILAVAVTIAENSIICIEEPEIYLHPELQKKFIYYITNNTSNQYIVTTHSNAVFDCPGVNIYHCLLNGSHQTQVKLVTTSKDKYSIINDLGSRASDILQSNCIIWVEGPSDRIYLNKWIKEKNVNLIEGLHYSVMFYGGRLLSHLTVDDDAIEDFIKLNKLNKNVAILIDSDKKNRQSRINETKRRIQSEIAENGGYCWVTKGKEIENYICEDTFHTLIKDKHGQQVIPTSWTPYSKVCEYVLNGNVKTIDKVSIAKKYSEEVTDYTVLDLEEKVNGLVDYIEKSNLIITNLYQ